VTARIANCVVGQHYGVLLRTSSADW